MPLPFRNKRGLVIYLTAGDSDLTTRNMAIAATDAVAEAIKLAPKMGRDKILMVNVSGRGDKDMGILTREMSLDGNGA
jgi:tryptophan synthase beta subunit